MREMKDSGIAWIGEIPADWGTRKIKFLHNNDVNSYVDGDWIESPVIVDSGIRYYTTGNIGDGIFKNQGMGYISEETFIALHCKYAYSGDLIISRLNAPYGRSCILPKFVEKCIVAVDNVILRTDENKRYICYVTQCSGYQKSVEDKSSGTTMKRISRTKLGNVKIPLPSSSEQQEIADFLDAKCGEIDGILGDIEAQVETLEAYKRSVITEAVTKGLRPDAEMKDSGVAWIGEIPADWGIRRFKYIHEKTNVGESLDKKYWSNDSENCVFYTAGVKPIYTTADFPSWKLTKSNDLLLARNGTPYVYLPTMNAAYTDHIIRAGIIKSCDRRYARYALQRGIESVIVDTVSISTWSVSIWNQVFLPYPKFTEQQEIADFLDAKCGEIDALIAGKKEQAETLRAYKKSLIFEYVTGKKEVPRYE